MSRCFVNTVVPVLGDPHRARPPDVYGHVINVPTHLNVKLPASGGHLPNADADSHLLVVRTCYNGQCKQIPCFRWSFQPKIAHGAHPKLRPTVRSNFHAAISGDRKQYFISRVNAYYYYYYQFSEVRTTSTKDCDSVRVHVAVGITLKCVHTGTITPIGRITFPHLKPWLWLT